MSYDLWGRLTYVLSPQFDIYEQVAKVVHGNVADIGCGSGFGTHVLSRSADQVVGFEIDADARNFATRVFTNGNIRFDYGNIVGSMPDGEYDFITMIDVIEHIQEDSLAVQNCRRLLKPGGKFICSTPNKLSRYRKSNYHVREYSPQGFKALLSKFFQNVDILNYQLDPIESDYENPMIGVCL